MLEMRASGRNKVQDYADKFGVQFFPGEKPWGQKVDIIMPCATQNELNGEDAQNLIKNQVLCVGEISNMGCTPEAIDAFIEHKMMYAPGKAVNAGGVATSALEMTQNSERLSWIFDEVNEKLEQIMINIYHNIDDAAKRYGMEGNYVAGANIAGFEKVVDAMTAQGIV